MTISFITDPECPICGFVLNSMNVATWEDGSERTDVKGRQRCKLCTEHHDSIDWDEN